VVVVGQRLGFRPSSAGGVPYRTVGLGSVLGRPAFSGGRRLVVVDVMVGL